MLNIFSRAKLIERIEMRMNRSTSCVLGGAGTSYKPNFEKGVSVFESVHRGSG